VRVRVGADEEVGDDALAGAAGLAVGAPGGAGGERAVGVER